jgi:hypothetical protein
MMAMQYWTCFYTRGFSAFPISVSGLLNGDDSEAQEAVEILYTLIPERLESAPLQT